VGIDKNGNIVLTGIANGKLSRIVDLDARGDPDAPTPPFVGRKVTLVSEEKIGENKIKQVWKGEIYFFNSQMVPDSAGAAITVNPGVRATIAGRVIDASDTGYTIVLGKAGEIESLKGSFKFTDRELSAQIKELNKKLGLENLGNTVTEETLAALQREFPEIPSEQDIIKYRDLLRTKGLMNRFKDCIGAINQIMPLRYNFAIIILTIDWAGTKIGIDNWKIENLENLSQEEKEKMNLYYYGTPPGGRIVPYELLMNGYERTKTLLLKHKEILEKKITVLSKAQQALRENNLSHALFLMDKAELYEDVANFVESAIGQVENLVREGNELQEKWSATISIANHYYVPKPETVRFRESIEVVAKYAKELNSLYDSEEFKFVLNSLSKLDTALDKPKIDSLEVNIFSLAIEANMGLTDISLQRMNIAKDLEIQLIYAGKESQEFLKGELKLINNEKARFNEAKQETKKAISKLEKSGISIEDFNRLSLSVRAGMALASISLERINVDTEIYRANKQLVQAEEKYQGYRFKTKGRTESYNLEKKYLEHKIATLSKTIEYMDCEEHSWRRVIQSVNSNNMEAAGLYTIVLTLQSQLGRAEESLIEYKFAETTRSPKEELSKYQETIGKTKENLQRAIRLINEGKLNEAKESLASIPAGIDSIPDLQYTVERPIYHTYQKDQLVGYEEISHSRNSVRFRYYDSNRHLLVDKAFNRETGREIFSREYDPKESTRIYLYRKATKEAMDEWGGNVDNLRDDLAENWAKSYYDDNNRGFTGFVRRQSAIFEYGFWSILTAPFEAVNLV
ncbi:hypothetical protein MUO65_06195, partial [bacterium]|nr:hypothetical protein [bacterium]